MESAALQMKWEHCCAPAVQTDQDDATSMKSRDCEIVAPRGRSREDQPACAFGIAKVVFCLLRQDFTRCRLVPAAIIYR